MKRFSALCEPFASCDVGHLVEWISAISFEDWPQQSRLDDGKIRPAMVTDEEWHSFALVTCSLCSDLVSKLPGMPSFRNRMLSVVIPGHTIPEQRKLLEFTETRIEGYLCCR